MECVFAVCAEWFWQESHSMWRKPCFITTLSTTNPTWTDLGNKFWLSYLETGAYLLKSQCSLLNYVFIHWHGNLHSLTYWGSNTLDTPVFLISLQFIFHVRFFWNSGYLPTTLHVFIYKKKVLLTRMSDLTRCRKFPSVMHIIHRGLS
jgi:hypothetical protein